MTVKKPDSPDRYIRVSPRTADRYFVELEIGLSRALLESVPKHLAALHMLGGALSRARRHEEALEVDRRITLLSPRDACAFYNLACSHSNLGQLDEALSALSRALKLGYRDFGHMMTDRDLKSVRRDPRFKRLLDKKWGKRQP